MTIETIDITIVSDFSRSLKWLRYALQTVRC